MCTREYPILLVLQFCEHGSLLSFLRRRRGFDTLNLTQRLMVALNCARGMEHLASAGMVHRDLAARNVLVDSAFSAKVADFGLSRRMDNHYYRTSAAVAVPLRWTAVEILTAAAAQRRFTTKTDVWSDAILLHEIFSDGNKPYRDMSNAVVVARVSQGYRLPRLPTCPSSLYALMQRCWDADTSTRPDFTELVTAVQAQLTKSCRGPDSGRVTFGSWSRESSRPGSSMLLGRPGVADRRDSLQSGDASGHYVSAQARAAEDSPRSRPSDLPIEHGSFLRRSSYVPASHHDHDYAYDYSVDVSLLSGPQEHVAVTTSTMQTSALGRDATAETDIDQAIAFVGSPACATTAAAVTAAATEPAGDVKYMNEATVTDC